MNRRRLLILIIVMVVIVGVGYVVLRQLTSTPAAVMSAPVIAGHTEPYTASDGSLVRFFNGRGITSYHPQEGTTTTDFGPQLFPTMTSVSWSTDGQRALMQVRAYSGSDYLSQQNAASQKGKLNSNLRWWLFDAGNRSLTLIPYPADKAFFSASDADALLVSARKSRLAPSEELGDFVNESAASDPLVVTRYSLSKRSAETILETTDVVVALRQPAADLMLVQTQSIQDGKYSLVRVPLASKKAEAPLRADDIGLSPSGESYFVKNTVKANDAKLPLTSEVVNLDYYETASNKRRESLTTNYRSRVDWSGDDVLVAFTLVDKDAANATITIATADNAKSASTVGLKAERYASLLRVLPTTSSSALMERGDGFVVIAQKNSELPAGKAFGDGSDLATSLKQIGITRTQDGYRFIVFGPANQTNLQTIDTSVAGLGVDPARLIYTATKP